MNDAIRHSSIERAQVAPLIWALFMAVVVLAGTIASGGLYLNHRREVTDKRAETERQGICGILTHLPTGIPSLDTARKDFRCTIVLPPKVLVSPSPHASPTPTRHVKPHPSPSPRVIWSFTPTPGPTVTVTKTPRPQPTSRHRKSKRHPTRHPTPQPSPSTSCLLGICLPTSLPLD